MDTARLKPCRGVSRGETVQRGDQFPFTARVTRREHSGFEQCMGHIAPSAPGNTDLSQKLRAALVDRHLAIRFRTRTGNRGKESSCTSASDCDLLLRHQTTYTTTRVVFDRRCPYTGASRKDVPNGLRPNHARCRRIATPNRKKSWQHP